MTRRYTRSGIVAGGHTGTQIERRDAAIKQVRALLAEKPMSVFDLTGHLHIPASTIGGYLRHLQDMGEAYQMEGVDARGRKTWAASARAIEATPDRAEIEHAKRARIVKAQQIGMWREPLHAALFGPAPAPQQ